VSRLAHLLPLLLACGCDSSKVGQACQEDAQCGSGFDCYELHCARVCTKDEECARGTTCQRYRCLDSAGRVPGARVTATPGVASPMRGGGTPGVIPPNVAAPLPDATAAELRALRRDVELLQQGQARILELLERKCGAKP
jgi:hypothetical protein